MTLTRAELDDRFAALEMAARGAWYRDTKDELLAVVRGLHAIMRDMAPDDSPTYAEMPHTCPLVHPTVIRLNLPFTYAAHVGFANHWQQWHTSTRTAPPCGPDCCGLAANNENAHQPKG